MGCGAFVKKLSETLKPTPEKQGADAAVALLLKCENQALKVLLVKRVERFTDPWSGQMALPGGKRDAKDRDLEQTVIRETLEETSIDLLDRSIFLGAMEPLRSTQRPEMKILPFVVLLEREPVIKLNEELEDSSWISLEELAQNRNAVKLSFGEEPAYTVENRVIWGLTYRILEKFFHILETLH
ncbi:MAG: CoA pyrophosphatase [Candidatus Bathyarchaeota archaeon]|nr:MAG: CoA pyrophosphatase [Candidatus Bathyarchaeota archaeon]